jgi:hypothetical protein
MFNTLVMYFCTYYIVKGLMKKEVKRHAAIIMYNKLKDDIISNVPLQKNFGNK